MIATLQTVSSNGAVCLLANTLTFVAPFEYLALLIVLK